MKTVEQIIEAIDSSTLLGAAWDCLSDAAKDRFKKKLLDIIDKHVIEVEESYEIAN